MEQGQAYYAAASRTRCLRERISERPVNHSDKDTVSMLALNWQRLRLLHLAWELGKPPDCF
jgi:hypothetical protein